MNAQHVKSYLKNLNINFEAHKHPPVYTCEESEKFYNEIKGVHCKSLFTKSKRTKEKLYLFILPCKKRLDIKSLNKQFSDELTFGNKNDLQTILNVKPGSVSPFTLLNDKEHKVNLIIDKEVWNSKLVAFHPNINTETLDIKGKDFQKYINSLKNKHTILEL